eukprot:PhM_4_TR5532/c0_g1_i1/m.106456
MITLARYKTWMFDLDGVIIRGRSVIPGAKELIHHLKHVAKCRTYFVTNNATKSRAEVLQKLQGIGLTELGIDDVYVSSYATAQYLRQNHRTLFAADRDRRNVYVLGQPGLLSEIRAPMCLPEDVKIYGPEDAAAEFSFEDAESWVDGLLARRSVGTVVCGLDLKLNLYKLSFAAMCIRQGATFVATNPDPALPVSNGVMIPSNGSVVAALAKGSGKEPDVVCGKPNRLMFDILCKGVRADDRNQPIDPATTVMVGDRLTTDIAFGIASGVDTVLVLTGAETEADIARTGIRPTHVKPGVADILSELTSSRRRDN